MIDLIVTKLKTHPEVKNVVRFGSQLPQPPYTVVKAETTNFGFVRIRINAHFKPDVAGKDVQLAAMDAYIRKDVYNLLHNVVLSGVGADTRKYIIRADPENSIGQVVMSNSDGTISQDRIFRAPEIQD